MFNTEGYSLSDVAAVTGNNNAWGNDGSWWIIILFLFCFMGWGGNGFGNNGFTNAVSSEDMHNQFNFASLERQNNEIVANSRQVAYDLSNDIAQLGSALNTAVRDQGASLNENIRDSQSLIQGLGASMENCCCMTNRNIDSVRYDAALNTRDIMKNDCDNTQKILDAISENKISTLQNQINQLQLQNALCGVIRYPQSTTYTAGYAPMYGPGCGCGCNGTF